MRAAADVDVDSLTTHYTEGLARFHEELAPRIRRVLEGLSGGAWDLSQHRIYAAGSDVDLMSHVVDAYAHAGRVHVAAGDWWGFKKSMLRDRVFFDDGGADLACACLPSVRNGHVTDELVDFLSRSPASLWNLNLWPTIADDERHAAAALLAPQLPRALLSVSFSRGFGMTASQLGVLLVPPGHGLLRHDEALLWFTYFHNAIAARAFCAVDVDALRTVDSARRAEVDTWLRARGLPSVTTGSYYVKSFRPDSPLPDALLPLARSEGGDTLVRLCFKPTST